MSADVPPPKMVEPHWAPDDPKEPITGSFLIPATLKDVKEATKKAEKDTAATDEKATISLADALIAKGRSLGALVLATIALTVTVLGTLDARSQTKVDGGIAPFAAKVEAIRTELSALKAEVKEVKAQAAQTEMGRVRDSTMIEMLVVRFRMEPPPPVLTPDGGR